MNEVLSKFILDRIIKTENRQGVLMTLPELHHQTNEKAHLRAIDNKKVESYQKHIRSLKEDVGRLNEENSDLREMNQFLRNEIKTVRARLRELRG